MESKNFLIYGTKILLTGITSLFSIPSQKIHFLPQKSLTLSQFSIISEYPKKNKKEANLLLFSSLRMQEYFY
jgi:hypothetical protein